MKQEDWSHPLLFCAAHGPGKSKWYNSICFSLWGCSLPGCFRKVFSFIVFLTFIPSGNLLLTVDYLCLVSVAISSPKGESNAKTSEWRSLSSTFTSHRHGLHPPVRFHAMLHGEVNLKWMVLLRKAQLQKWYISVLLSTRRHLYSLNLSRGLRFPKPLADTTTFPKALCNYPISFSKYDAQN